jgi:hypothetical protein
MTSFTRYDLTTVFLVVSANLAIGCTSDHEQRLPHDSAQVARLRADSKLPPINVSPALQRALARPGITVEYRWLRSPGDSVNQSGVRFVDPWTNEPVSLAHTSFLDLTGVRSAEVRRTGDGALVMLQLTDSAGQKALVETDAHMGQKVGVLLNGELVTVATITNPMPLWMPLITDIPATTATDIGRRIMGARDKK